MVRREIHAKSRRRRVLADDACPSCGTAMKEARGRLSVTVNGVEIAVAGASHLRCPRCEEVVLRASEARRLQEDAVAIYRRRERLLSAEEIRGMRRRLGLSQGDLARLLRLGANTVSRWEAGRNAQTGAMDVLLRLIRDLPGSLAYLRKHAA